MIRLFFGIIIFAFMYPKTNTTKPQITNLLSDLKGMWHVASNMGGQCAPRYGCLESSGNVFNLIPIRWRECKSPLAGHRHRVLQDTKSAEKTAAFITGTGQPYSVICWI